MKKIICLLTFLLVAFNLNAQDVITFRDGRVIQAKIFEADNGVVRYRLFDGKDDQEIVAKFDEIEKIRFSDGKERLYILHEPSQRVNKVDDATWNKGFSASVEFTKDFTELFAKGEGYRGFGLGGVAGYQFSKIIFVGGGIKYLFTDKNVSFQNSKGVNMTGLRYFYSIPIFATFKMNFSKTKVSPFFRMDLGMGISGYQTDSKFNYPSGEDLYINPEFGVDFKFGEKQKSAVYVKLGVYSFEGGGASSFWRGNADFGADKNSITSVYIGLGYRF